MRKRILFMLIMLLLICVFFLLYRINDIQLSEPATKAEMDKCLNENFEALTNIANLVHGKNGYFYVQYIDGKLDISSDIDGLFNNGKMEDVILKQIEYIINELGFIGIYKDSDNNEVIFEKKNYGGGSGIIYSINKMPKSEHVEVLRDNWFYYYWFGV